MFVQMGGGEKNANADGEIFANWHRFAACFSGEEAEEEAMEADEVTCFRNGCRWWNMIRWNLEIISRKLTLLAGKPPV